MKNLILREPVLTQGVVQAVLGLVLAFGVGLSAEQCGAILATSAAVLSLITRTVVTPTGGSE